MGGFRDLEVYRRAARLADELHRTVVSWPSFERWTVGAQLVRAADSIGANIAEACGRNRHPDQRRLLFIARGSAWELEHWIERARQRELRLPEHSLAEARRLSRMLNALLNSLRAPSTEHRAPHPGLTSS